MSTSLNVEQVLQIRYLRNIRRVPRSCVMEYFGISLAVCRNVEKRATYAWVPERLPLDPLRQEFQGLGCPEEAQ